IVSGPGTASSPIQPEKNGRPLARFNAPSLTVAPPVNALATAPFKVSVPGRFLVRLPAPSSLEEIARPPLTLNCTAPDSVRFRVPARVLPAPFTEIEFRPLL